MLSRAVLDTAHEYLSRTLVEVLKLLHAAHSDCEHGRLTPLVKHLTRAGDELIALSHEQCHAEGDRDGDGDGDGEAHGNGN